MCRKEECWDGTVGADNHHNGSRYRNGNEGVQTSPESCNGKVSRQNRSTDAGCAGAVSGRLSALACIWHFGTTVA